MHFVVTLSGTISVGDDDGNQPSNVGELITSYLSSVMDEFYKINVQDPDIELDLSTCSVQFSILVEGLNPLEAIDAASPKVRSAIHGAGGSTPNWPETDDQSWAVRLVNVNARQVETVAA